MWLQRWRTERLPEGYAIGDAIKQLPENLQRYLISEVPRQHTTQGVHAPGTSQR